MIVELNSRTGDDGISAEADTVVSAYLSAVFPEAGLGLTAVNDQQKKRVFKRFFKQRLGVSILAATDLSEIYTAANTAAVVALKDASIELSADILARINLVGIESDFFNDEQVQGFVTATVEAGGLSDSQMENYIETLLPNLPLKYAEGISGTIVKAAEEVGMDPEKALEQVVKHMPDRGEEFLTKAMDGTAAVIKAKGLSETQVAKVYSALESSSSFKNADATKSAIFESFRQSVTTSSDSSSDTTTPATTTTSTTTTVATPVTPTVFIGSDPLSLVTGVAMTAVVPTGTDISTCAVDPQLPHGLELDATTCTITGTPTTPQNQTTYTITVTASSSNLTATDTIKITVLASSPSISYSSSSLSLTNGTTMTAQTPVVSAGTGASVQSITVSPTLPTGLSISSSTGVISGTPTAASSSTTYTVTVANDWTTANTTVSISVAEDFVDDSAANFAGGGLIGVEYSSGNIQLAADTDCDGNMSEGESTKTNCMKLDPSWTPHYADIIAYYDMESTSDIINSTAFAATTNVTFGSTTAKIGAQSAVLGSTSSLDVSTSGSDFQIGTGDFTIAFWTRVDLGADNNDLVFQWLSSDNNDGFRIRAGPGDGTTRLEALTGGTATNYDGAWVTENNWVHYAVIRTSGTMAIYLNGVFLDSGTENINLTTYLAGQAIELAPHDQTSYIDEFAVWDVALTATEISLIYHRQVADQAGYLTSRVIDAGSASNTWDAIGWKTDLPYLKKLPGDADGDSSPTDDSESTSAYSALPTTTLQTGMRGYFGQESALGSVADTTSVNDSTGLDDHLAISGNDAVSRPGLFGNATFIEGGTQIVGATEFGEPADMTYLFWFYPMSVTHATDNYSIFRISGVRINWRRYAIEANHKQGGWNAVVLVHTEDMSNSGWRHVTVTTSDNNFVRFYIDGVEVAVDNDVGAVDHSWSTIIGDNTAVTGAMDEITVWERILSADEILALYRRGSNRVVLQFRICTAADCSDNPRWLSHLGDPGADQSNQGVISELLNSTPNSPTVTFSDYAALNSLVTGRYFQYRIILETDNMTYSPKVSSVTVTQ